MNKVPHQESTARAFAITASKGWQPAIQKLGNALTATHCRKMNFRQEKARHGRMPGSFYTCLVGLTVKLGFKLIPLDPHIG
jgi:hypothetical protein